MKQIRPGLYKQNDYFYTFLWTINNRTEIYTGRLDAQFNDEYSLEVCTQFRDMMYRSISEQKLFVRWNISYAIRHNVTRALILARCPVLVRSKSTDLLLQMKELRKEFSRTKLDEEIDKELFLRKITGKSPWIGIVTNL